MYNVLLISDRLFESPFYSLGTRQGSFFLNGKEAKFYYAQGLIIYQLV